MTAFSDDEALAKRLRGLAGGGGPMPTWSPAGGRAVDGEVLHDSRSGAMEAVRSAATAVHRQLIVRAAGITIVLDITSADVSSEPESGDAPTDESARMVVRGQIASGSHGPAVVQFVSPDGDEGALAMADEYGEFDVEIGAGNWLLVVADDLVDVSVPIDLFADGSAGSDDESADDLP